MTLFRGGRAIREKGESGAFATLPDVLYSDIGRQVFSNLASLNGSSPTQLALISNIPLVEIDKELDIMIKEGLVEKDAEEEHEYGIDFAFHSLTQEGFRIAHEYKLSERGFFR